MKNSIKAWVIWLTMAAMPLSVSSDNSERNNLKNQTNIELSTALQNSIDSMNLYIPPQTMTQATLNYFDEEVKLYKLSPGARSKITSLLNSYFSSHYIFMMNEDWNLEFVIDDKKEFSLMVKNLVNIVIDDIPFFVRRVWVPIFLWSDETIQRKLDNLDDTFFNLKEKQYKDVVLDYIGWISKRVASSTNWKITVWEYYEWFSQYYPNKNWKHILEELNRSGQAKQDIKNYKYKR